MTFLPSLFRRRRRSGVSYIPVATYFEWITAPNGAVMDAVGATRTVLAAVTDQKHVPMATGQPTVTYSSGTTAKVTISGAVMTAVANGTSVVTAHAATGGWTDVTATATVQQWASTLVPSPSSVTVSVGSDSSAITAGVFDRLGSPISGAPLSFLSSDASLATVGASSGIVHGVATGSPVITVSSTVGGGTASGTVSVTVTVAQYLSIVPSSVSGAAGGTTQLQVLLMPGSTDITSRCVFSSSDITIATIDAPTLTSISPSTITQGTNASYTFTGTNIKGIETIGGLPSGVTASGYSYTSTTVVCTLTATGSATTGAASLYLACNRGNSGTQTLTVNSSAVLPPTTGLVRRYVASSGTNTTTDGASISSWVDTIAGASLAVGGTPGLAYVANALNGKPGIKATNSPGYLTEAAFDAAINTPATTIACVYKHNGTSESTERPVYSLRSATSNGTMFEYPGSMTMTARSGTGSTQTSIFGATDAGNTFHTAVVTASTPASQTALYIDNVQQGTTVSAAYSANATDPFQLFGVAALACLQGTICEVLIYDHVFSGTERTALANYILSTYAI